MSVGFTAEWSN